VLESAGAHAEHNAVGKGFSSPGKTYQVPTLLVPYVPVTHDYIHTVRGVTKKSVSDVN
jgi:hypothetical protein